MQYLYTLGSLCMKNVPLVIYDYRIAVEFYKEMLRHIYIYNFAQTLLSMQIMIFETMYLADKIV